MMRRAILALAAPLALSAGAAGAATIDFGQLATEVRRAEGRELQWSEAIGPGGWTVDGVTVMASDNAHLDAGFRSNGYEIAPGGLGLCNSPSGDCNASDFDGVREAGERLSIMFDRVLSAVWTLRETTDAWRNGTGPDHTLANGCAVVNGVETRIEGGSLLDAPVAAASWSFEPCAGGGSDFYVTAVEVSDDIPPAPVPLPAGAALLATALGVLGFQARRKAAR